MGALAIFKYFIPKVSWNINISDKLSSFNTQTLGRYWYILENETLMIRKSKRWWSNEWTTTSHFKSQAQKSGRVKPVHGNLTFHSVSVATVAKYCMV